MQPDPTYLVVWTERRGDEFVDFYEAHESRADAQRLYDKLRQDDDVWGIHIALSIVSTEFSPPVPDFTTTLERMGIQ